MQLYITPYTLALKHPFTIATYSRTQTPTLLVELHHQGIVGYGEASMPQYLGESQQSATHFLLSFDFSSITDPFAVEDVLQRLDASAPGNTAAKAAIDIALHDWIGKALNQPLYRLWGGASEYSLPTSYTIGIDTDQMLRQKIEEASAFSIYKVKLGSDNDRHIIQTIRSVTDKPLYVDANQGWTCREEALDFIGWLQEQGVVLVEQPFAKENLTDSAWLTEYSPLPIIADESCQRLSDLHRLQGCFTGINIKLMKCTGLHEARQMITVARYLDMKVMLGCMTETSCAISAAAQLLPYAHWADLDGNQLIANDPFRGVIVRQGNIRLTPDQSGIQVSK